MNVTAEKLYDLIAKLESWQNDPRHRARIEQTAGNHAINTAKSELLRIADRLSEVK